MTKRCLLSAAFLFTSICTATTVVSAAPTITNLGYIPGGIETVPNRVSADGTTVVGQAQSSAGIDWAFRWTASTGAQYIGPSDLSMYSYATGVSSNGSVVALDSFVNSSPSHALRWTASGGLADLGSLPGGSGAVANGTSSDGSVIVGSARNSSNVALSFRWTAATGIQALPLQNGFVSGTADAVSADGKVTVGYSGANSSTNDRAYRYTTAGGYQNLGVVSGFDRSVAIDVSGDGNTVVGNLQSFNGPNPAGGFRWTAASGIQGIGLAGDSYAGAEAVSFDGSRIVGYSGNRALLWTSTLGSVDLNTYLPTIGVDLTGWDLSYAAGISADGTLIVGSGTYNGNQAGWIVNTAVPEPGAMGLLAVSGLLAAGRRCRASTR